MAASRDGSARIIDAMIAKLLSDFTYTNVHGLTSNPIITDTVTPRTPEPYVYIYEESSEETWVTNDSESREYHIIAQIMIRDEVGRGTTTTRDDIANEVIRLISDQDDYPDVSLHGYSVQRITTDNVVKYDTVERGGKFYVANIMFNVTAYYSGFAVSSVPVATPAITYSGWTYAPTNNRIEAWDAGTATVGSTYSASNGWNYTSSTVALEQGISNGTLNNRVLTIPGNDSDSGLTTTFTWTSQADSNSTRTTAVTTDIDRIKSVRYGAIASANAPVFTDDTTASTGLRKIADWNGGRRVLNYGNASPLGDSITVNANAGEWIYIIYDASIADLSAVRENVFNQNVLSIVFSDPVTVGGYKIYIAKRATSYNDTFTYALS